MIEPIKAAFGQISQPFNQKPDLLTSLWQGHPTSPSGCLVPLVVAYKVKWCDTLLAIFISDTTKGFLFNKTALRPPISFHTPTMQVHVI